MTETPQPPAQDSSDALSRNVIDFERAEVISLRMEPPIHSLVVAGQKPYANMEVRLEPLTYVRQPEYWGIEVVGYMPSIGLPAIVPFSVELPLAGVTGTCGVEVMGASHTERIDLPPPAEPGGAEPGGAEPGGAGPGGAGPDLRS